MRVDLIEVMGSDLTVVNAARVSFDKQSDWNYWRDEGEGKSYLKPKDVKLIEYLAKHKHWSPFSHPQLMFRIKAPIFVARQLAKHQVGLAWNEVSRRYVDTDPEFFTPDAWRASADDKKQGSSDQEIKLLPDFEGAPQLVDPYVSAMNKALTTYKYLLSRGVCPEQARMVLPQSMYTEWYWTGSLYAFARVCHLRLSKDSQKETQFIAKELDKHCERYYPNSWKALMKGDHDEEE